MSTTKNISECESQLHRAVVKAILRSPLNAFSHTAHYLKRNNNKKNKNNQQQQQQPPPPYHDDIKNIFDALNPKYNVVSFSTIAKLFTIAAGNPTKYRCDESDAKEFVIGALKSRTTTSEEDNERDDHDDQSDDDDEPDATTSGGLTFKQFCSCGDELRTNMMEAGQFGTGMSEHDKCLLLQHKIMETISAKKSNERQKVHQQKRQSNNNIKKPIGDGDEKENDINDDDDSDSSDVSSDTHVENQQQQKQITNTQQNQIQQREHKLHWFEVAFLKEAHTQSLLERPDSDKLTSSYRQAPSFFRSSTASLLSTSSSYYENNNDHSHHYYNRSSPLPPNVIFASSPPKPLERKLPRSTSRSTIAPYYDKKKAGTRIAHMPTMERVSYQHHRGVAVTSPSSQRNKDRRQDDDDKLLKQLGDCLM